MTRVRLDSSWARHGDVVVAGSPLRLFRLTPAGTDVVRRIERGTAVEPSSLVGRLTDAGAIHPQPEAAAPHRFGPGDVTIVTPIYRQCTSADPRPAGSSVNSATTADPLLIVVDDGSLPAVPGATIRSEVNRGPAAARNLGLGRVSTPLVAFVDDDVTLPDDWLTGLLGHFDDDRVGVVAPRVRTPDAGSGGSTLARYEHHHSPLDLGDEPARIRVGTRVSYVPAAALVCRTDAVRSVGGFDESLRLGEDVDFVWRLDAAGWTCRYESSVVVHHAPRPTWRAWARQRVGYGSSAAPLSRRHPGALAPARMSGWSAATWLVAAAGRPFTAAVVGVGSALALPRRLPIIPAAHAFRLAALGNLRAGISLATAVRRVWWPIIAVAALRSRTGRRILVASLVAARHPVVIADDACYSVGVWLGMWRERTAAPLLPRLGRWPGRDRPAEGGR